ncbi:MAG: calcium/sodium antiporter [Oscillospiraceae bacterium]|nr:calcium/sodium antiporter [Oscillospiraceae bacterium]
MKLLLDIVLLLVGFVLLIKGADFFVDGASSLAKKLRVPSLIVGLTIVAMGTSAPELAVSVSSAIKGSNALAVSNVIGSNLFNLLIVLGVCSAIKPTNVAEAVIKRDYPISLAAAVLFVVFIFDGKISRIEGGILLVCLIAYIIFSIMAAKSQITDEEPPADFKAWKCALFILGGAAGIVIGGDLVVDHAQNIALMAGMSETLVGLTICAVGTSLPELVTSLTAAKKGENDMAVGNVVGSNLFNILGILGVSGLISPIDLSASISDSVIDGFILLGATILVFICCITGRKISRIQGGIMAGTYVIYMAYAIMRNYGMIG